MADPRSSASLSRRSISDAVGDLGWRYVLGALQAAVRVASVADGCGVVSHAVDACGEHADGSLRADVRSDAVVLTLQSLAKGSVTSSEIDLARRISDRLARAGLAAGTGSRAPSRSVQMLEIAIDAADIAGIRPFWKAVMGYVDEAGHGGPEDPLVDPVGQGPAIWFQHMAPPRRVRNRIHLDVSVPHDEAERRVQAATDAGGVLVSDSRAPAFWVLADVEGNEVCVTTWQGRD